MVVSAQAWGFVVADRLPDGMADLSPNVRIVRASDDELERWRRERPQLNHMTLDGRDYLSTTPPDLRVTSRWAAWFRLEASSLDAAETAVRQTHIPALEAALVALTGRPALVELLRLGEVDQAGYIAQPRAPWSLSGTVRPYGVATMDSDALAQAKHLLATASRPGIPQDLARMLADAQRTHYYSAGLVPLVAAALLGYFHVVERIAAALTKGEPKEMEPKAVEAIIGKVTRELAKRGTESHKARVVQNASRELDRLKGASLSERIQAAGRRLGVPDEFLAAAQELARLRNTRLGHPSTTSAGDETLSAHLESAQGTAAAFLSAYVRRERGA